VADSDTAAASALPSIGGLDVAHSNLVRALLEQPTWSRSDLEDLAATFNLMPDGAVDRINEPTLDACDEPLLDE
jgi:TerB-C domain